MTRAGRAPAVLQARGACAIRPFAAADEDALLALYQRGFDEPVSREALRWRFLRSPGGRAEVVSAFAADGRCLASFGGVSLPCRFDGELARANAACNIVLDPGLCRQIGGARLLIDVGTMFFDLFGGGGTRMVFGCPRNDLLRILSRHLRVEVLWDVAFLVGHAHVPPPPPTELEVRTVEWASPAVGDLWQRCCMDLSTYIERDPAYLGWRFAAHPTVPYQQFEVVDRSGAVRGFAVTRSGGWSPEILSLVEWIVPRDDREAEFALLARVRAEARTCGLDHVVAWFSPNTLEFLRFQHDHGFHCRVSPHQQAFRTFSRQVHRDHLYRSWFQTMGDLEFF